MKSTVAYYLMLLYLTVMIHPLLPIVADVWCHAFSEINHLATVHAKYGTHHLEISLSKSADENNGKNNNTGKIENFAAEHFLQSPDKIIPKYPVANVFPLLIQSDLFFIFLLKHTPPPKFYC